MIGRDMSTGSGTSGKGVYDVVVVGLGAMGSAALYQLARRGARVLGIDRFRPPHTFGSSHGDSRITRQAIGEGAVYTPLVLRANQIWEELEARTGEALLYRIGALVFGNPGSGAPMHKRTDFLARTMSVAVEFGIPHELLTGSSLRERFPQFRFADDDVGYFEPGGGYLRPERCVEAQLRVAEALGADVRFDTVVSGIEPTGDGDTVVRTAKGTVRARRVVLSAGPWAVDFLSPSCLEHVGVYRQVVAWFRPKGVFAEHEPARMPVFIRQPSPGEIPVYGLPAIDANGVKVASEQHVTRCRPEASSPVVEPAEREGLLRAGRQALRLTDECTRAISCLYTVTSDGHFVIDWHPELPGTLLVSPCSGHGFKHSAAIGELAAQLTLDEAPALDISAFALSRFGA